MVRRPAEGGCGRARGAAVASASGVGTPKLLGGGLGVGGVGSARGGGVAAGGVGATGGETAAGGGVQAAGGDLGAAGIALAEMGGLKGRGQRHRIAAAGGTVITAASLVDRSGGNAQFDMPFFPLIRLDVPTYEPDALPPELEAIPAIKPGSRAAA